MNGKLIVVMGTLLALTMNPAWSTLIDNGDGTFTDTSSNLMWLIDANYAKTSGYDDDGYMNWYEATSWAENLVYAGYDDWRLPIVHDVGNDGCDALLSSDPRRDFSGGDCGFNTDTSLSEFAHLFHDVLGNGSYTNPDGSTNTDCISPQICLMHTSADGVQILNFQLYPYWLGPEYAADPDTAWAFYVDIGFQYYVARVFDTSGGGPVAWAVRDIGTGTGTPPSVPAAEPTSILLMCAGMMGLVRCGRRH